MSLSLGPRRYGADSCVGRTLPSETCALSYLATADDVKNVQYVIIWVLTAAATASVLTGLNRGIVTNAKVYIYMYIYVYV